MIPKRQTLLHFEIPKPAFWGWQFVRCVRIHCCKGFGSDWHSLRLNSETSFNSRIAAVRTALVMCLEFQEMTLWSYCLNASHNLSQKKGATISNFGRFEETMMVWSQNSSAGFELSSFWAPWSFFLYLESYWIVGQQPFLLKKRADLLSFHLGHTTNWSI